MLTVRFPEWCGLGNQLFILAALESFATTTKRQFYLELRSPPFNPHSTTNYFDTIFGEWKAYYFPATPICEIYEPKLGDTLPTENTLMIGFFQDWRLVQPVRKQFIERLRFNKGIVKRYPDISKRVFVHVRGGDYLTWEGFVDLTHYYETCLSMVNDKIVVFTDDIQYAQKVLKRPFECIEENEEDTLYLMSQCERCICSNSTFSWWGAYLNPNRQIFIPSKWNKEGSEKYSFPGTTIVDV
jgi:hypothetical protein